LVCPKSNLLRDLTAPNDEREVCENRPLPCRVYAKQRQLGLGSPDVVTAPSRHVIDIHREYGVFRGVETRRVFLGVEQTDEPVDRTHDRTILYVGQLTESKGLDTLLDAAERLPKTTIHVCGSGTYADHVERRAGELNNVRYHGFVSEEKLTRLRSTAGVAVVPSIWMENSPMTIYESFAAGLPVIASDIGGIPELVDHGKRGYLFEPRNVAALVDRIDDVLSDPETAAEMSQNVADWAAEHSIETHVDELLTEVYDLHDTGQTTTAKG
jgi:glycosyltransferase involved in cell wall biosynthesis